MNCKVCSNTTANTPGIPFFRFPREEKKCERWAELCHLKHSYKKNGTTRFHKSFRICSEHFDADEMMHDGRKVRLFPSAEPKFLLKKYGKSIRKKDAVTKKSNSAKISLPNHFCRLCAEEKKDVISIYGWRGKTTYDLEKKLKYFPFAIDKCDVLPLGVCQECMVKVDQFAEFIENCINAEAKLKELLNNKIFNLTVKPFDPGNFNLVPNRETQIETGGEEQRQKADTGKAQNTNLDENLIRIDSSQLLNGNEMHITTQNISFVVPSHPPPVSLPVVYQTSFNFPIKEKNQTQQDCQEPQPVVMNLLTLNHNNNTEITLHNDPNSNYTYTDVQIYNQFPPPQITDQTVTIHTNFDNIEKLNCDICSKGFETAEMLNAHLKAHSVERNNIGFKKYTAVDFLPDFFEEISKKRNSSNTEPHDAVEVKLVRTGSQPKSNKPSSKGKRKKVKTKPECEFCEKLFPTFDECEEHEKTHQGIQRYECLICKAKFRSKRNLHRHIPVHSGKIFPCPDCKTIFKRKDSLQSHGRIHRKLTCKICSSVFKRKAEFLKHEKNHGLSLNLPTELDDTEQARKKFRKPDLPESTLKKEVSVPEAPVEFSANTTTIQPTCILIPVTKMDAVEQIVLTRIV